MSLKPVEYKVLIRPEPTEEVTEGGIFIPKDTQDREQMAQVRGEIIAVGGNCFEDWQPPIPEVGQTVWFRKHAGAVIPSDDEGPDYRLVADKEIGMIVDE